MKELKPKIIDIRVKRRLKEASSQTSLHCPQPITEPSRRVTSTIEPLQPQKPQELPPSKQTGWQRLTAQAERINQLAAELEAAMFELKAIATDINCVQRLQQYPQKLSNSVCEYLPTVVPYVAHKQSGTFVLTKRSVDLFQAEREATQVAEALRSQAKRKRVVPRRSRSNKH